MLKSNQKELKKNIEEVEMQLGIRPVKGHTCEPEEYHRCAKRLAMESNKHNNIHGEGAGKSLLAVSNKATLVIESNQACRRGRLRKDGSFEVGADMDLYQIRRTISKFAGTSNERIHAESEKKVLCQDITDQIMYEFGVQNVKRASSLVTSDQMAECLSKLLNKDAAEKEVLRRYLAGQSLGIAGHGHLCHLGDDGSIIIPTNCS